MAEKEYEESSRMKAKNIEELIKALRCSATPPSKGHDCTGCPYLLKEELSEEDIKEFGMKPDIEKDGKGYWCSCDCDTLVLDAVEQLERMQTMLKL